MSEPAADIDLAPIDLAPIDHSRAERPIALLRWPEHDAERRRLVALGEPRVLLISPHTTPPSLLDDLEIWMLNGTDPRDLLAATAGLRRKAGERRADPLLDDDGLLWFEGRWIAIPDTQLPVVDLLVANTGRLVRNDDLRAAYHSAGGSRTPSSFRTLIRRIRKRVTAVGLALHVIRQRGVMLATAHDHGVASSAGAGAPGAADARADPTRTPEPG